MTVNSAHEHDYRGGQDSATTDGGSWLSNGSNILPLASSANLQQTSINPDVGGRASDHLNRAVELVDGVVE